MSWTCLIRHTRSHSAPGIDRSAPFWSVTVQGSLAAALTSSSVYFFDVTNPVEPVELSVVPAGPYLGLDSLRLEFAGDL
jgi:hypothetical protein